MCLIYKKSYRPPFVAHFLSQEIYVTLHQIVFSTRMYNTHYSTMPRVFREGALVSRACASANLLQEDRFYISYINYPR